MPAAFLFAERCTLDATKCNVHITLKPWENPMIRIFVALAAALGLGALLAQAPWPVGWLGAAVLLGVAVVTRIRWERRARATGDDPGAEERAAWQMMAGLSVTCGHLAAALMSGRDLHVGSGNALAGDNWLLGAAAFAAWFIVRPRLRLRDERDREIAALGHKAAFWATLAILLAAALLLGFGQVLIGRDMLNFNMGNWMLVILQAVIIANFTARLVGYWLVNRPMADADA
jgi:hypothetical protein